MVLFTPDPYISTAVTTRFGRVVSTRVVSSLSTVNNPLTTLLEADFKTLMQLLLLLVLLPHQYHSP